MDNNSYLGYRKTAILLTVLVLLIGSIYYFSTEIAERNNEMMFKEIYGENATLDATLDTLKNDSSSVNTQNADDVQSTRIRLV